MARGDGGSVVVTGRANAREVRRLTSNEVEALRWVQAIVRQFPQATMQPRAFAVLDRLIKEIE